MPKSSVCGLGRGFLRLERSGPRLVMIVEPSVIVDPFVDTVVIVVATDPKLPAYGLPEDTVIAIALSKMISRISDREHHPIDALTVVITFFVTRVVVCDRSSTADVRHLGGIAASPPREHPVIQTQHAQQDGEYDREDHQVEGNASRDVNASPQIICLDGEESRT